MIDQTPKTEIADIIRRNRSFLLCGHVRPDADSYGSQLALARALGKLGKRVTVWIEGSVPSNCRFLSGEERVVTEGAISGEHDVIFVLDTPRPQRLGSLSGRIEGMGLIVNIDHHASNTRWGDVNWVDGTASATTEFIYLLLEELGIAIDHKIAASLYAGIVTDTGRFCYANTTPFTHFVAAKLLESGFRHEQVADNLFCRLSPRKVRLLGKVLETLRFDKEGAFSWVWVRKWMFEETGSSPNDVEGIINCVRDIDGVKVAALFEEQHAQGRVRVSLRSRDRRIDVDQIASRFGGGGHAAAAGILYEGSGEELEKGLRNEVRNALRRLAGGERFPCGG